VALALAFRASSAAPLMLGIATAARMPRMTMTMTSSIRVKPVCLRASPFESLRLMYPLKKY
jgi:hypothetical protein